MPKHRDQNEVVPEWLKRLRRQTGDRCFTASGNAWIRFHKWAFMRYPPQVISKVEKAERQEIFRKAKSLVISYQYVPDSGESANALLYLCSDKDYNLSKLSVNNRSKVRRGLKRLDVRRTTAHEIGKSGYQGYFDTCARNGIAPISKRKFQEKWEKSTEFPSRELWAAFVDDEIAAFGEVLICGKWAELLSTKSADKYLKDYPNHALFYSILYSVLHREGMESISYGLSSVQAGGKKASLHHFKLSVNFDAIPVVRRIELNPFLRPLFNKATIKCANLLGRLLPKSRHILAARGAFELLANENERNLEQLKENDLVSGL